MSTVVFLLSVMSLPEVNNLINIVRVVDSIGSLSLTKIVCNMSGHTAVVKLQNTTEIK